MDTLKAAISLVAVGMFGVALAQEESRVKLEFITDDGAHEDHHQVKVVKKVEVVTD